MDKEILDEETEALIYEKLNDLLKHNFTETIQEMFDLGWNFNFYHF